MNLFGRKKKIEATAPKKQILQQQQQQQQQQQEEDNLTIANNISSIEEAIAQSDSAVITPPEKTELIPAPDQAKEEQTRQHDISLYNSLLAGLYDAVLIVDNQGSVIGSNHRCDTSFGYEEGEIWEQTAVI